MRRPRTSRNYRRETFEKYEAIRVTGGFGAHWNGQSRNFWIQLRRPLKREVIEKELSRVFGEDLEHVSHPLSPESCSYAFRVFKAISVKKAWNLTVEALGDVCLNGR